MGGQLWIQGLVVLEGPARTRPRARSLSEDEERSTRLRLSTPFWTRVLRHDSIRRTGAGKTSRNRLPSGCPACPENPDFKPTDVALRKAPAGCQLLSVAFLLEG